MRRLLKAALFAVMSPIVFAGAVTAEITHVTATGGGGVLTDSPIGPVNPMDHAAQLGAHYTADAPIDFVFTVQGGNGDTIDLINPNGKITNSTVASFPIFYASLRSASAGGQDVGQFGLPTAVLPADLGWGGPPNLVAGHSTFVSFASAFPEPIEGFETVATALGPKLHPISTWTKMLIGFAGLGCGIPFGALLAFRHRVSSKEKAVAKTVAWRSF
jgi:hypothetical protein